MKPVVGLTGGIASGKSTVAAMFAELGIPVIDADQLARAVVEPGTSGLARIVSAFGEGVLDSQGKLDRKALGDLVFSDPRGRETLNAIMHPLIAAAGVERIAALQDCPAPYLLYEAALLVETGTHERFAALIVVHAAQEVQRKRLLSRDGLTVEEAESRIASQLPTEHKLAVADYVVNNDGDVQATRRRVRAIHRELSERFQSAEEPS
jgi:dephospho-CoA kinase